MCLKCPFNYIALTIAAVQTLHLCQIDQGCVELQFQIPSFVEEDIFPLSVEQERSLTTIGVTRLTCRSYRFPQPAEVRVFALV